MEDLADEGRIHPRYWALLLVAVVAALVVVCSALFAGTFRKFVPVTLTSDRSGLVMESGGKVKMRGVQVGRVAGVNGGGGGASLKLEIFPGQVRYIPANVEADIRATTAFGAKYVELIYPERPSPQRIAAGQILKSRNVSTEVNTVFEHLVGILHQVDPSRLNAALSAIADGLAGQGERIGQAITGTNEVLAAINPRMGTVRQDVRSFGRFSDAYSGAASDILGILDALTTTSATITAQASDLNTVLLSTIGLSNAGINLLGPNQRNLVDAINVLQPTTDLLLKYNPEYTCMLVGAKWSGDNGINDITGGNGKSVVTDSAILLGDDPYRFPENLPIVAAKGGPGGKPSCGSLPDASKDFPVRQLITNTGWGTGLDIRPNPGIGQPCWVDYFPVTRAVPQPPSIRRCLPGPAPGPDPGPGMPPYGAPWYGPGGVPLWPGVPPAPNPAAQPAAAPAPDTPPAVP